MRSSLFGLLLGFIRAVVVVALRRFRGSREGPRSVRAAVITELLRRDIEAVVAEGLVETRHREMATPVWPGLARRALFESAVIAGVPGLWITPKGWSADQPTLLYFHGGGYCFCSSATHRVLVAQIAIACGARCLALDYRLAPQSPFPAAIDDANAAYRGLLDDGVDPKKLFVGGDSAGGGLAMALLLSLRDAGRPLPRGTVLLSPWVDLACTGQSIDRNSRHDYLSRSVLLHFAEAYLGPADRHSPFASPLYGNLAGLPPLLVQVGELETLLSEGQALAAAATAAGVETDLQVLPGAAHVSQAFAALDPSARPAIRGIGSFVRRLAVLSD